MIVGVSGAPEEVMLGGGGCCACFNAAGDVTEEYENSRSASLSDFLDTVFLSSFTPDFDGGIASA